MTTPSGSRQRPAPLVVVGASAGGVEALRELVTSLPAGLGACVLVVLHVPADSPSALPAILRRRAPLPVRQAEDGDELRAGQVLVARPDHHLVVADGVVLLTRGPKENGHRPAVDVLFRSAARARGRRTLAVVLSGLLDDGAAGAVAVAARGGRVAVQDPDEALYDSMPRSTARAVEAADQLGVAGLAELIARWAEEVDADVTDERPQPTPGGEAAPGADDGPDDLMVKEVGMARMEPETVHDLDRPGRPSGLGCPDCAGALFQIEEGPLLRFRCRVGHAWSAESLLARKTVELEGALWVALRSLEERAALNTQLGERASGRGDERTAARFGQDATEAQGASELVRQLLTEMDQAFSDTGETVGGTEPGEGAVSGG